MKILHVIETLSSRAGGPVTVIRSLSKYQARSGLEVTICSTKQMRSNNRGVPIFLDNESFENGVKYLYFSYLSPLKISFQMAKWFQRRLRDFDIVHIHGLYRFPLTYAAYLSRKMNIAHIISPHGSLDPFLYKQSRYNLHLKRIYECLFDVPNLHHTSAIHYTSKGEADRAAFLGLLSKPVIVPNGIDWEHYKDLPSRGSFRNILVIDDQTPLVLFLGRINFVKGLDLLVPAFSQITKYYPEARLAIVGPDNDGYKSKVRRWCNEERITDKVFFLDQLESEKVKQAYVDSDVFVSPSYTENFGMTVLEAMACGCPVVISDQVKIWREVQEDKAGLVVRLEPGQIANAICQVLGNKESSTKMGFRGRLAAQKRYSWPRIVEQMTQVYHRVLKEEAHSRTNRE